MDGDARLHKIWTRKALIPCWTIQILWLMAIVAIEIIFNPLGSLLNTSITVIICIVFCLIFNVVEIIIFALGRLRPFAYLWYQVVKTTIWLVFSIIALYDTVALHSTWSDGSIGQYEAPTAPVLGLLIALLTLATCLAPLFCGTVVYYAQRTRDGLQTRGNLLDDETTLYDQTQDDIPRLVEVHPMQSFRGEPIGGPSECNGVSHSVQILKSEDEMRDVLPAYEMAPVAIRGSLGAGLRSIIHDDYGPYELPDRRSTQSHKFNAM